MAHDPDERQAFHIGDDALQPVGPGHDPELTTSFDASRLDFGHYAGSSIEELASSDPEYLRWLVTPPARVTEPRSAVCSA